MHMMSMQGKCKMPGHICHDDYMNSKQFNHALIRQVKSCRKAIGKQVQLVSERLMKGNQPLWQNDQAFGYQSLFRQYRAAHHNEYSC